MKKQILKLITGIATFALGITPLMPAIQASQPHTVTDMDGQQVKLPPKVNRVADLWHANNEVVLLLGGKKKLVATTPMIKKTPWFKTVDSQITKVKSPFAGQEIQVEELLKTKPDVVIAADPAQIKTAKEAKLPVVNAMFQDFAGLRKSIKLTAQVLGGNAPQVAKQYLKTLDYNIQLVKHNLQKVQSRPTVLHIVGPTDLTKVDGTKTIVDEWIKLAGGKNAIQKSGNMISVTSEELVKANPSVIIIGQTSTKHARQLLTKDARFKNLKAVKNHRVYGNPQGAFPWDRYSGEEALQILWAAKLLHPKQMQKVDLTEETQNFYQKYYHYHLSNQQAHAILAGEE